MALMSPEEKSPSAAGWRSLVARRDRGSTGVDTAGGSGPQNLSTTTTAYDSRALPTPRQFDAYRRRRMATEPGIVAIHPAPSPHPGHLTMFTTWTGLRTTIRFAKVDDPHIVEFAPRSGRSLISAVVASGRYVTIADGKREEHEPDSLALTWTSSAMEARLVDRGSVAAVQVERDLLHVSDDAIRRTLDLLTGRPSWYADIVRSTTQAVGRVNPGPDRPPSPDGIDRYAASILELVIRSVATASPWATTTTSDQRRRQAERFVAQNLLDPKLSANSVAGHLAISPRQLARDLAGGPSAATMIQEARLQYAYRLLRDPTHAGLRISRIAELCGFSSQPQFSRSFKAHFGVTPRQVRAIMFKSFDPGDDEHRAALHVAVHQQAR